MNPLVHLLSFIRRRGPLKLAIGFLVLIAAAAVLWSPTSVESDVAAICGDVDASGAITITDLVSLYNYCYTGTAVPPGVADADCDDYDSLNIRDLAYLDAWIFLGGAAPTCPPTQPEYAPTVVLSDTVFFSDSVVPALATSGSVTIAYTNAATVVGYALPLSIKVGSEIPHIDSVVRASIGGCSSPTQIGVDTAAGAVNLAGMCYTGNIAPGTNDLAAIYFSVASQPYDRAIVFDTLRLPVSNSPMFIRSDLTGIVPHISFPTEIVPDTLAISLYSPVNMVVHDPLGDSISPTFNTIGQGSTYDTLTDGNGDGEPDDIVTIPIPYEGDYQIEIYRESGVGDSAKYSLAIRINGNSPYEPEEFTDRYVPPEGEPDTVTYEATTTYSGDVNADGTITSADIIYMVNYVFKGGAPAVIPGHSDVNCDGVTTSADIIYLVNYVFKGGAGPCSVPA